MIASRRPAPPAPAPRPGFTLIELLVVISILAVLAALIAAGAQRVRSAGQRQATADLVTKLQVGLDNQVDAFVEQVRKDRRANTPLFTQMVAFADGNPDRAEALLVYCKLRQNFPQSAAELGTNPARGAVMFTLNNGAGVVIPFPRPQAFDALVGLAPPAAVTDPAEREALVSSALLSAALSSREYGGIGFASEDVAATNIGQLPHGANNAVNYYRDAFGKPVGFRRFGTNEEMQHAPYANEKRDRNNLLQLDPFDPQGLLFGWQNAAARTSATQAVFHAPGAAGDAAGFDGRNRLPTVYSAGADAKYNFLNVGPLPADDILGYRLRKLGSKGTK